MSDINKTGGAAFPKSPYRDAEGRLLDYAQDGMTLRDYFAGQALQGILSSPKKYSIEGKGEELEVTDLARGAYILADAMIAERSKP